jgi:hypothetical protein
MKKSVDVGKATVSVYLCTLEWAKRLLAYTHIELCWQLTVVFNWVYVVGRR